MKRIQKVINNLEYYIEVSNKSYWVEYYILDCKNNLHAKVIKNNDSNMVISFIGGYSYEEIKTLTDIFTMIKNDSL